MQNVKIIFNIDYLKEEVSVICENDNHFNRVWKIKGENDVEKSISEALIYIEDLTSKLN